MQLKKIRVYGNLRLFLGRSYFEAAVKSPKEAVSFLTANFEGVQKHMNEQIYKVKLGGKVVTEEYLSMSGEGDIQIIPVATGSLPVVLGIGALAGGSALTTAFTTGISGFLLGTVLGGGLTAIGSSLVIGGITDLIAPQKPVPSTSDVSGIDPNIRGSYSFNNIQNVSSSGVPVPILYGLVYSGSIVINSGIDSARIRRASATATWIKHFRSGQGVDNINLEGVAIKVTNPNHGFKTSDLVGLEFLNFKDKATDRIYAIFKIDNDNFMVFDEQILAEDSPFPANIALVRSTDRDSDNNPPQVRIYNSVGTFSFPIHPDDVDELGRSY